MGRAERMLRRGEGGHRRAAGRLGCRLEGPQQLLGCRSSRGADTPIPQRKAGLRSPQTLTAEGTSRCEVTELVLSPGCAEPPGDSTKLVQEPGQGAGLASGLVIKSPRNSPNCYKRDTQVWTTFSTPPLPRLLVCGRVLAPPWGAWGPGGDEGPDLGFLCPFFPHGLQFNHLCDGSRHPFP